MREQQRRNWRHGSAAESGVGSACRPPQRSGRTVRKSAVSVKVSADGPGLLTLAVPGNQKTARGGLGGDFYAPPAHGLGRCRADRNPRVGKRVKDLFLDHLYPYYVDHPGEWDDTKFGAEWVDLVTSFIAKYEATAQKDRTKFLDRIRNKEKIEDKIKELVAALS